MKVKIFDTLIIDDHPLITEAYKSAFKYIESNNKHLKFNIEEANTCDAAFELIKEHVSKKLKLDLVFLDMRLPASEDGTIISGEDLGVKINELLPETKIIVSTTFNDSFRVHSILKSINPDGFLVKNDITPDELVSAIKEVLVNPPYYSKTVMKLLRNNVTSDYLLDDLDRKIIYELSIGTKTKDLPKVIPLSITAIEKRKRHLKSIFDIDGSEDRELILAAKEKGFL